MKKYCFLFFLFFITQVCFSESCYATSKQLIVIDAGHGGEDIGAQVRYIKEKVWALRVAYQVKKQLNNQGYRVILTRSRDEGVSLKRRVAIANRTKSTLFVSIHFNAYKLESVKGIEIFYYNKGSQWRCKESKCLANDVLSCVLKATGASNRGVKSGNFHVIRETQMPAILIEGGFITNPEEYSQLAKPEYVVSLSQAIAQGIQDYFSH